MAALSAVAGYLFIVVVHTAIAAVATRFFRVRMQTRWSAALYAIVFVPLLLVVSTMILSGPFRIGATVGSRTTAVMLVIAIPLTLGYAIDLFWMPAPEEIDLPERERSRD